MKRLFDRRWLVAALLAAFGLALTTQPASANPDTHVHPGIIVGVVQTPDGTPVPRARVGIYDIDRQRFVFRTVTSDQGRFRTGFLRPGRYFVYARHPVAGWGRVPARVLPGHITPVRVVID